MHQKVEFAIRGKVNGVEITPQTIGLSLFNQFNQDVEDFLKGSQRNLKLSEVPVRIEDGSYKLIPTLTAAILVAIGPDLRILKQEDSLGEIDAIRAEVISKWQRRTKSEGTLAYEINATGEIERRIFISKTTDYRIGQVTPWVRVEKYDPHYDEAALDRFIEAGSQAWADVPNAVEWIREMRGGT